MPTIPNGDARAEFLPRSSKSLQKTVSLNAELADRLSWVLHSRPEFSGLTMATVAFRPGAVNGDLQILFADESWNAAARVARVYELTSDILRSSSEAKCNRFVVCGKEPDDLACGVCVRFENAPVAVIIWSDLPQAMPLLDLIEAQVNEVLRVVGATGSRLSERELEVIKMSADGMTSAEIGLFCDIAETTVNAHIAKAMKKTGARTRTHLISMAIRNGHI